MKKALAILFTVVLILAGCTSGAAKKLMEETKLSVADGDYDAALNYGELAVKEGCKDEEFLKLLGILKNYKEAKTQFEEENIDKAKEALKKTGNTDGSGMTQAVDNLGKEIKTAEKEIKKMDEMIGEVEGLIAEKKLKKAINSATHYLESESFTEKRKDRLEELRKKAEQERSSMPVISQEEAIEIAKTEVEISPSAKVNVTLNNEVYIVNIETAYTYNGETNTDGVSCMIDGRTREIVGLAG